MGGIPPLSIRPIVTEAPSAPRSRAVRVLVVDDLPEICAFFRDVRRRIRSMDVHLETETNSQRAIERIQAEPFDIVVSDFRMREAHGIDVLRAARQANPDGHRILMTGYNEIPAPMDHIQDAHVDAYIQKPLETQELLLVLLSFLRADQRSIEEFREHAREMERVARQEESIRRPVPS
ncbi:MAG TPA: response regulator [Candidatus Thermoplasmatota archaeon]|nr:response regulator [Candidatus Thermoplasmatota archaeon]